MTTLRRSGARPHASPGRGFMPASLARLFRGSSDPDRAQVNRGTWAREPASQQRPKPATAAASVRHLRYASSPLLASRTPPWRARFCVALVGLAFLGLLARAVWVQGIASDFFNQQGELRFSRTLELTASRGRITDRHGVLLAASVQAPSLFAEPKALLPALNKSPERRRQLAATLGMTVAELNDRLDNSPNFVWLRRQVDEELAAKVRALKLAGVGEVPDFKRRYPEGEAMAPVVGITNIEELGQEGMELVLQSQLAGKDGKRQVIRDRLGRVIEGVGEPIAAQDGHDIKLTLDSRIQYFAYQRLKDAVAQHRAKAGSAVVIDVQSGEVLAMANYPSFKPEERHSFQVGQMKNRVVTDTFEPGSTMKPFIIAKALDSGKWRTTDRIQTAPGSITITGATIRDSHVYGELTVEQVLQKSSNVGTVKIAMTMERREMWELFNGVGIGQRPTLEFPGAVSGRLRPYKSWRPIEQATMSYGYGLSTSLFQLAHAYTVFANDGRYEPLTLVRHDDATKPGTSPQRVNVFSPQTAASMRHLLQLAASPGGTAPKAQVEGYSVGGKTGTARKQAGKGYAEGKYRAWFVGLSPVKNPRVVVAVMIDEPSAGAFYAGEVAAPVFSAIVQQTLPVLGVAHDREIKPGIVSKPLPAAEESI